ncbi:MAG TPA: hypothetical protein VNP72_09870 [Longimicrobium sp.]|nr:hypothetical protein [Longimicrobium sp.]
MIADALRVEVLRAHGAGAAQAAELLPVTGPVPAAAGHAEPSAWPLPDERCVAAWDGYAADAVGSGVLEALRGRLVQLRFPIVSGISDTDAYRAATRRGELPAEGAPGLALSRPEALRLFVHPTPAGRIPVLVAGARDDFETLVRALTRRNEPAPVPPSMGACIVGGYNNWDRVRGLRTAWERENPGGGAGGWDAAFRALIPDREAYQDRFVLLSAGPYSAVPAGAMGLEPDEWLADSLTLRLEHECAHYFSRRVLGSMRNALHDELVADFAGIVSAAGCYRAEWFTRFLGVEDHPRFRVGGRLENYRGDPPLSPGAFGVLRSLVVAAAAGVEAAERAGRLPWGTLEERAGTLLALSRLTLEELADGGGAAGPAGVDGGAQALMMT